MVKASTAICLAIPLVCGGLRGCLDQRCGDDLEYRDGVCVPRGAADLGVDQQQQQDGAVPGADLQSPDWAGQDLGSSMDSATAEAGISGMGDLCQTATDCTGGADYCAVQPGHSTGYCTVTGCDSQDSGSCPAGYYCFDLSAFDPQLPKICAKQ